MGLIYLDLSNNQFGSKGIEMLSTFIKHKKCILKDLNISDCRIHMRGAAVFFNALLKCTTMQILKMNRNEFGA